MDRQPLFTKGILKMPRSRALRFGLRSRAPMADDSSLDAKAPRVKGGARRQAGSIRRVNAFANQTLASDLVNRWTRFAVIAVTSQVIGSLTVDIDIEDSQESLNSGISG